MTVQLAPSAVESARERIIGIIRQVAETFGLDPGIGLATAEIESNFDQYAVGDTDTQYSSHGIFQERLVVGRGGFRSPDRDPERQSTRFYEDVKRYLASGGGGTPGQIAAAVQRPKDQAAYALKVDRAYTAYTLGPNGGAPTQVPGVGAGAPAAGPRPNAWQCSVIATFGGANRDLASMLSGIPVAQLQSAAYACAANTAETPLPFVGDAAQTAEIGKGLESVGGGMGLFGAALTKVLTDSSIWWRAGFVIVGGVMIVAGARLYMGALGREGGATT